MIGALFALWFLFGGGHVQPQPKCPPLHSETTPVYEKAELYGITGDGEHIKFHSVGTSTYEWRNMSVATVTLTSAGLMITVGQKIDPEAIEYNKRVKECQTKNGEF